MKNEKSFVGLFQGMFENNILTFNPGWDENAKKLVEFDDVRTIRKHLESNQIKIETKADVSILRPASFVVMDPDGNAVLIDQHV